MDSYFNTAIGETQVDGINLFITAERFVIKGNEPAKFKLKNVTNLNVAIVPRVNTELNFTLLGNSKKN